jgi:GTPase Era involved in 16S rRNA processing
MNNDLTNAINDLKAKTLFALNALDVIYKNHNSDTDTPTDLADAIQNLHERIYTIPIFGEIKRGKSSFLNAILGQDILPVDDFVATSQAFSIMSSTSENIYISFVDGSIQNITKDEINSIGSQAFIDEQNQNDLRHQDILYVNVEMPNNLLPDNIRLIDTPGLGTLHSFHSEITYRVMEDADAAIFVLDSDKPVQNSEIKIIGKLMRRTKDILFIQTKIDLYPNWVTTKERNEQILGKIFDDLYGQKILVYPVSNFYLKESNVDDKEQREILLEESRYEEIQFRLQSILFKKSGYDAILGALSIGENLVVNFKNRLHSRLVSLEDKTNIDAVKRISALLNKQNNLRRDWGEKGIKRKDYIRKFISEIKVQDRRFDKTFKTSGKIYKQIDEDVQDLNRSELNELFEDLSDIISENLESEFIGINEILDDKYNSILEELYSKENTLTGESIYSIGDMSTDLSTERASAKIQAIIKEIKGNRNKVARRRGLGRRIGRAAANLVSFILRPLAKLTRFVEGLGRRGERLDKEIQSILSSTKLFLKSAREEFNEISDNSDTSTREDYFIEWQDKLREFISSMYDDRLKELGVEIVEYEKNKAIEMEEREEKIATVTTGIECLKEIRENIRLIEVELEELNEGIKIREYDL